MTKELFAAIQKHLGEAANDDQLVEALELIWNKMPRDLRESWLNKLPADLRSFCKAAWK